MKSFLLFFSSKFTHSEQALLADNGQAGPCPGDRPKQSPINNT